MCGIFGLFEFASAETPPDDRLRESARLLAHRGPDGTGVYAAPGLGLVHTRLSLLDLSERSNQPFWDASGRHCLIYNGEVYNFQPLRAALEKEGVSFRTTSDTEVVLAHLIRYGAEETVRELEGMFAFGWYDVDAERLIVARDKFGIKPLFVWQTAERFLFASEAQALRPWVAFEPDLLSISAYLQGAAVPTRGVTLLRGVQIVPPGSVLRMERNHSHTSPARTTTHPQPSTGHVAARRYFDVSQLADAEEAQRLAGLSEAARIDLVEQRLLAAVEQQMIADAPVGGLCSGGVDSSLVAAMAKRFKPDFALFHANVLGRHSEYEAAQLLAKHLQLDLHAAEVRDADFLTSMAEVTRHFGHPFWYHANSVPFLFVARKVRQTGFKAVLSGEGADELFHGYTWMTAHAGQLPRKLLGQLRRGFGRLLGRGPTPPTEKLASETLIRDLHSRFEQGLDAGPIQALQKQQPELDTTSLHWLNNHLRTLLQRNDCLGMAASIEARFPFLDTAVARTAVNLPLRSKWRYAWRTTDPERPWMAQKWILRQVAARYLPPELSNRKKLGFPTGAFGRATIAPQLFEESYVRELFGLDREGIAYLLHAAHHSLQLKLLHLDVWARIFLCGETNAQVTERLLRDVTIRPE